VTPARTLRALGRAGYKPAMLRRRTVVKVAVWVGLLLACAYAYYYTPLGEHLQDRSLVHGWVKRWPALAPLIFVAAYVIVGTLALPVFWLQVLAGYSFGILWGVIWCQCGSCISGVLSMELTHWLVSEEQQKVAAGYKDRVHALSERLGHNGLLVVSALRLVYVAPFGVTNYLLGLFSISRIDMVLGTILGGTMAKMINVAIGVGGPQMLYDRKYLAWLVGVNALLLLPLALRYWRPEWFKRIGVE
jgi:uncharacterized membrane protein YdjX (TVP38/TMEM64 family)